jgi:DNA-binding LacI/PurR family transcriptional regulator
VVPEDLSVVGFDDGPVAVRTEPALTTVHQDVAAKGHLAAAALIDAIKRARSGSTSRARHVTLETKLIVRGSTSRPRA